MKTYDIPEDLALFMDKALASEDIRDRCIKSPFGFRRAKRSAADVQYFKRKFWTGLFKIYPELEGKKISYSPLTQKATYETPNQSVQPTQKTCG